MTYSFDRVFPQKLLNGTSKNEIGKDTKEVGKKTRVNNYMKRSTAGMKK